MATMLRVGVVQMRSGIEPAANRAAAAPLIREAASGGARLIATPENTIRMDKNRKRLFAAVGPEEGDPELKAWGKLAAEHGVWLLVGSGAIQAAPEKIYNRSFLFAPDGKITARYNKINMFDVDLEGGESYRESETVEPGTRAVLAEGPGGVKLGLTICYDLRFAPLYAALAQAGAEVIAIPSAFTVPTGRAHWETLIRARAIETGAYVIAPAQGGQHEDGRATWGHSMIVAPWGEIIAAFDHDDPGVLIADLNLAKVAEARAKVPAWRGGRAFTTP
ncbi:MAG: carbon-nitrogen hydrolase family protein [Alphaproteobacteria bacterium]|nr:carbon-nitrogen hydrolase family protein [Alphaproteobacteria bacterium]